MGNWSPDSDILGFMLYSFGLPKEDGRILDGARLLTWKELSEEVKSGTRFGREYYKAFKNITLKKAEHQKEFVEWKKNRPQ